MENKIAVYPGSFDPITYGHIDVIERSLKFFEKIIVAVSYNTRKKYLFTLEERVNMVKEVFKDRREIEVDSFRGLLVDYLRKKNVYIVIRGLRAVSDFEYEFQMALINRKLNPEIETIFMMPKEEFFYISSSLVKEIAELKGNLSYFVPEIVEKKLREKFS
ncbi:MAG: pantetheine-phosphate adenylyltransferase [Candidatus Omnitrophota bacterium]|nr:MAG: pantetheine-phosphate adenylyltransferase [Candidatus Omnitrophota bacterium]